MVAGSSPARGAKKVVVRRQNPPLFSGGFAILESTDWGHFLSTGGTKDLPEKPVWAFDPRVGVQCSELGQPNPLRLAFRSALAGMIAFIGIGARASGFGSAKTWFFAFGFRLGCAAWVGGLGASLGFCSFVGPALGFLLPHRG